MLDIEYIKQIDEMLDVDGVGVYNGTSTLLFQNNATFDLENILVNKTAFEEVYYPLYLQRVIEAINKKYNADDNYFNYRIIQKDDLIEVLFINEYCESYNGLTDESKESSIVYIMDHIKEKV